MNTPPTDKLSEYRIIDIVRKATIATGGPYGFSDAKERTRWERFKGFWKKVWTLAVHNAVYNSEDEMKSIMMDANLGDLNSLVCVYTVGVWNGESQTICYVNDLDSPLLDITRLPQDIHVDAGHIPCYRLAMFSSRIPFIFHVPCEVEVNPFSGKHTNFGFYHLDGALASMAPWEHLTHQNHLIVSVCDTLEIEPRTTVPTKTWATTWKTRLPLFLGNIYSVWKGAQFLYSDKALDQMVAYRLAAKDGETKKICEVPTMTLRSQVEGCPSWIDFTNHTDKIVDECFEVSYEWGKEYIANLYTPEERIKVSQEKTGMSITGGAALGYNQAPVIAAYWQMVHDTQVENGLPIQPPFNSFSGNSVGAIQAMFFAWLQDMYYDFDGDGREKLVTMMEKP